MRVDDFFIFLSGWTTFLLLFQGGRLSGGQRRQAGEIVPNRTSMI